MQDYYAIVELEATLVELEATLIELKAALIKSEATLIKLEATLIEDIIELEATLIEDIIDIQSFIVNNSSKYNIDLNCVCVDTKEEEYLHMQLKGELRELITNNPSYIDYVNKELNTKLTTEEYLKAQYLYIDLKSPKKPLNQDEYLDSIINTTKEYFNNFNQDEYLTNIVNTILEAKQNQPTK